MTSAKGSDLLFRNTDKPVGFTNPALAQLDGSPEPVIRELLQNSLDAAHNAERPGVVKFVLQNLPIDSLPGESSYRQAFAMARSDRAKRSTKPTHDEQTVCSRIKKRLDSSTLPVLFCVDNGTGIDPERMSSLLTPGNSDKGGGGAGSFGVGHLTAFAASDLRYVLYGSRYRTSDGRLHTVSSGHAILATHPAEEEKALRSSDGFWVRTGQTQLPFLGDPSEYPETAPPLLRDQLDSLDDTGTVVCVVGFNDFRHGSRHDTAESIARVAAQNFTDAVYRGTLKVFVKSPPADDIVVDSQSLSKLLRPWRDRNRYRAPRGGHIGGADAFRAYKTLMEGRIVPLPDLQGTEVRLRHLPDDESLPTKVHLYRKGMWITSRPRGLERSDFVDCRRFDAVVCLEADRFEELVRNAEGPEHLGLQPKRLSKSERKELDDLAHSVAVALGDAAGKQPENDVVIPDDFALLGGDATNRIERVRRPRMASRGSRRIDIEPDKGKKRKRNSKRKRRRTPGRGRQPDYASSLMAIPTTAELVVDLAYREELTESTSVAVRITKSNGSDASCDMPLSYQFLPIRQVVSEEATYRPSDDANLEVVVPVTDSRLRLNVHLEESEPDPRLLSLDLVTRRSL
ncbi:MAG: hypothetical protein OXH10_03570 [bacterium]|nr:hypothetical protein [bacterium]